MPGSFDPDNPYGTEVINEQCRLTYRGHPILPITRTPRPLSEVVKLCNQAFQSGLAEGRCQQNAREATIPDPAIPDGGPNCPACGVPFAEHLGLIPTCRALQEARNA